MTPLEAVDTRPQATALSKGVALLLIYVIWGSTYFAIRVGVESLPPFFMAGARFLLAGALLFAWARMRGAPAPRRVHWRGAAIVGTLLLCGGNGLVTWAEQTVPSGIAAVLIACVALDMVLLDRFFFGGPRLTPLVLGGLCLGMVGIVLLVSPGRADVQAIDPAGAVALLCACLSWALGSLYSRRVSLPASPTLTTAMEMLSGGLVLLAVGFATGEAGRVHPAAISGRSLAAFAYLVAFGSIVALSAYVWLLRVTSAAVVSTYAFVNPVVAVALGALAGGEAWGGRSAVASVLILAAVAGIHAERAWGRRNRGAPDAPTPANRAASEATRARAPAPRGNGSSGAALPRCTSPGAPEGRKTLR